MDFLPYRPKQAASLKLYPFHKSDRILENEDEFLHPGLQVGGNVADAPHSKLLQGHHAQMNGNHEGIVNSVKESKFLDG